MSQLQDDSSQGFWCKNSLTIQDIVEKEPSKLRF